MDVQELRMINNVVAALGKEPKIADGYADLIITGKSGEVSLQEYFVQAIAANQTTLPRSVESDFNLFKTINDVLAFEPDAVNLTVAEGAKRLGTFNNYTWTKSAELWNQYLTTLVRLSQTAKMGGYLRENPQIASDGFQALTDSIWTLKSTGGSKASAAQKVAANLESQLKEIYNKEVGFDNIPEEKIFENGLAYQQRTTRKMKELSARLRELAQVTLPVAYQFGHCVRAKYNLENNPVERL